MSLFERQLYSSVALSAFFLIVYPTTAAIAGAKTHVGSFSFGWEKAVPFVPLMIVPYFSIDLFFLAAPFLTRSTRQLNAFVVRMVVAISVAAVFFVLTPLRFDFSIPQSGGWTDGAFACFRRMDGPFNQSPSLHVALLLIVGDVFVRRAAGLWRGILVAWFSLIVVSPLLVYQHHVTDLLAGGGLGLLCLCLIPDRKTSFECNRRVAAYYAVGATLLTGLCLTLGRYGWPLWWPTLAVSATAVAYIAVGPSAHSRLGWAGRALFWPTLAGQRASLHWYARRCAAVDRLADRVWIGRCPTDAEAADLCHRGVVAVVNLTSEFKSRWTCRVLTLPTLDLTAPTPRQIGRAVAFIRRYERSGVVFVHCKVGYSRTAVVGAAYLLGNGTASTPREAVEMLRSARPTIVIRPEAVRAIEAMVARRVA